MVCVWTPPPPAPPSGIEISDFIHNLFWTCSIAEPDTADIIRQEIPQNDEKEAEIEAPNLNAEATDAEKNVLPSVIIDSTEDAESVDKSAEETVILRTVGFT